MGEALGQVMAVIPSYNPGPTTVVGVAQGAAAALGGADRVIVVDDGSTDGSGSALETAGYRVVYHAENQGKGMALRTGFALGLDAGADWVVTLDADAQHDPAEILKFLEAAAAGGADLWIGTRMHDTRAMPWLRRFANWSTSLVISAVAGQRVYDSQSGYRLISSAVLRRVPLEMRRYDAESEILVVASRAGFKIGQVPIKTIYGDEVSSINPLVDTLRFFRMLCRLAWRRGARTRDQRSA